MAYKIEVSIHKDIYPPADLRFFYVLHPVWDETMTPQMPSAVQCYPAGIGIDVKADVIPVTELAWRHIRATNNTDGIRYAESVGSLLCNRPPENTNGIYKYEAIISGGNIGAYRTCNNNRVKVIGFDYLNSFTSLDEDGNNIFHQEHNFFTEPWIFFECTSFDLHGHTGLVWSDVYCFVPKLIKGEHWMNITDLWLFPSEFRNIHFRDGVEVWNGDEPLVTFENGVRILHNPFFQPPPTVIPPLHRSNYIQGA